MRNQVMFLINNPIIRHLGAIGFLSMLGLSAAIMPITLYVLIMGNFPHESWVWILASLLGGGVVGWVMRR
jgi:hypothetical protein